MPIVSHSINCVLQYLLYCVVPENIQTPTTEGIGNSRGVGGSEAQEIPEGRGVGGGGLDNKITFQGGNIISFST